MSFMSEFREFAVKGNVVDLAVGVMVGAAFAKIIDSLVKNVIMPAVGLILPGEQGYVGWKVVEEAGWGPVAQVAIDATWSSLRFKPEAQVKRKENSAVAPGARKPPTKRAAKAP